MKRNRVVTPIVVLLSAVLVSWVFSACGTPPSVPDDRADEKLALLEAENAALEAELAEIRAAARSELARMTADRDELARELRALETELETVSREHESARARMVLLERENAAIQALIDELRLVVLLLRDMNRGIDSHRDTPDLPDGVSSPDAAEPPERPDATEPDAREPITHAFDREPPSRDPAEFYTRSALLSPAIERSPRSPIAAIGLVSVRDPETNSFRYYSERVNPDSGDALYFVIEQSSRGDVRLRAQIRIVHETAPSVTDAISIRDPRGVVPLPFIAAARVTDGGRWVETISPALEEFEEIVRVIEDERAELVSRTTTRDGTETTTRALSVDERDAAIAVITAFIELGGRVTAR